MALMLPEIGQGNTFVFWPSEGQAESQLHLFAERIIPKVRTSLAEKTVNKRTAA